MIKKPPKRRHQIGFKVNIFTRKPRKYIVFIEILFIFPLKQACQDKTATLGCQDSLEGRVYPDHRDSLALLDFPEAPVSS